MTFLSTTIGEEIFLQGTYLNVAFNSSGSIGSRSSAPTGVVTDAANGYIRLGMMADMDGFNTGKLGATRDAMLWGSALEGFSVGYDIGSKHYVKANSERNSIVQISGDATNLSDATTGKAAWLGATSENVKVSQVVTLSQDDKFMKFEVMLTNMSGSTLSDLRYMRSIDPDHGADFKTINTIVEQGGDGADGALVAAYMTNGTTPLFYYTQDDRARVSTYGLDNRDPYAAAAWDKAGAEGTAVKADQAININFGLGQLAAGASTTVTFYLGITDNLAATIKQIDAQSSSSTPPVVVGPVNSDPVAAADKLTIAANGTGTGNVLANDKDADGDALTASLKTGPANGTLKLAADGSYTYTPKAGFSGTDSFTYTATDGKATSAATVTLTVTPPPNTAPVAVADSNGTIGSVKAVGNVLTNDSDADGDALTVSLKSGPAHGEVTLAADGSYTYIAKDGFAGVDTFTYSLFDGQVTSSAIVTMTVEAPPAPSKPLPPVDEVKPAPEAPVTLPEPVKFSVLGLANVQDGSSATKDVLTGTSGKDVFFFDIDAKSGQDTIVGFDKGDLLATNKAIYDGNGDGIITWKKSLTLDGSDTVSLAGVKSLRLMGTDADGTFLYANGGARPKGALEGTTADDIQRGDATDKKAQTFFFDTKLGLVTGNDHVQSFGIKDRVVVTTQLDTDSTGHVNLGSTGSLALMSDGDVLGHVTITDLKGAAIQALEYDGAVVQDGLTYYVYSHDGSSAGVAGLTF